jgi:hypothetical protein
MNAFSSWRSSLTSSRNFVDGSPTRAANQCSLPGVVLNDNARLFLYLKGSVSA